jgi:hypothetical protein
MSASTWTDADTVRACRIWDEYQQSNNVASLVGQTAGIDPASGRIWFGDSAADIRRQRQLEGIDTPIYCVRVGYDYYLRKGNSCWNALVTPTSTDDRLPRWNTPLGPRRSPVTFFPSRARRPHRQGAAQ